jgi:hypothetical protein
MTLFPDLAEWVSVVRYDVMGGGLDTILLEVPGAWADQATIHLSGEDFQLASEPRGPSVQWKIAPRRPLWGSHRLVVRSRRPLPEDRDIVYPEIQPRGNGVFEAFLGVVNATGYPLPSEGSTGLQKIDPSTQFHAKEFIRDIGTFAGAYRVHRAPWVLRQRLPRSLPESGSSADDGARVALADLSMTVLPDRSIVGCAIYETVPDSGRLLSIELPADSSILWAAVDANPTIPLRRGPNSWSIALDARREDRICLIWRTKASAVSQSGGWKGALPRAGVGPSRSFLEVFIPPEVAVAEIPAGLEAATMARLEVARADWISQSIRSFLDSLDRSSGRDHKRLVSLLVQHELAMRGAIRAAGRRESGPAGTAGDPDLARLLAAQTALAEAVRSAGLRDDQEAALRYLGKSEPGAGRAPAGIAESTMMGRIRTFGTPIVMIGVTKGTDEPSSPAEVAFESRRGGLSVDASVRRAGIAVFLLVAAATAATLGAGYWAIGAVAAALVLGAAALTGGPTLLTGSLGLATIGWLRGGPRAVLTEQPTSAGSPGG